MRTGAVVVVVVAIAPAASADPSVRGYARRYAEVPAPLLELDPVFRPHSEGLGTRSVHHTTTIDLDPSTHITFEGVERANDVELVTRGWRTEARIVRNLGFALLSANYAVENIQSIYTRGTYVDMGIALTRTFTISRWNTAWISLSLGRRKWRGDKPPDGEYDSTQLMLSIGTTFR